jgi:DNA-binding XRE family transcriptional regulator
MMEANMDVQTYTTPDGMERVSMPMSDYQDLVDARDHAIAMRDVAAGAPLLTESELDAYLASPSPLAFWRKRAGLTQSALAQKAGITQAFLAQIESGDRDGTVGVLKRISQALGVKIEDLIADLSHRLAL